ncbi:hypothetical protein NDU88_006387 [Pleurodeles waltl]|uniref:Integrase catalytic domain-containing protein n=1 Tax=Pleurodeles waltl TaxID=8319 RepID=A0AAV7RRQ6_PLEWA|nr:hypothetical protein NDU88_006387 [Pleurodeles waltl]
MTEPPSTRTWPRVSLDVGSFPDGRLTAVMTDLCAGFLVVELLTSTAFENVNPANGDVERFMWTLNRALRIGVSQQESSKICLHAFLRAYRQTPHSTTGCSPGSVDVSFATTELDVLKTHEKRKQTNV